MMSIDKYGSNFHLKYLKVVGIIASFCLFSYSLFIFITKVPDVGVKPTWQFYSALSGMLINGTIFSFALVVYLFPKEITMIIKM